MDVKSSTTVLRQSRLEEKPQSGYCVGADARTQERRPTLDEFLDARRDKAPPPQKAATAVNSRKSGIDALDGAIENIFSRFRTPEDLQKAHSSATQIQRVYRGHVVRIDLANALRGVVASKLASPNRPNSREVRRGLREVEERKKENCPKTPNKPGPLQSAKKQAAKQTTAEKTRQDQTTFKKTSPSNKQMPRPKSAKGIQKPFEGQTSTESLGERDIKLVRSMYTAARLFYQQASAQQEHKPGASRLGKAAQAFRKAAKCCRTVLGALDECPEDAEASRSLKMHKLNEAAESEWAKLMSSCGGSSSSSSSSGSSSSSSSDDEDHGEHVDELDDAARLKLEALVKQFQVPSANWLQAAVHSSQFDQLKQDQLSPEESESTPANDGAENPSAASASPSWHSMRGFFHNHELQGHNLPEISEANEVHDPENFEVFTKIPMWRKVKTISRLVKKSKKRISFQGSPSSSSSRADASFHHTNLPDMIESDHHHDHDHHHHHHDHNHHHGDHHHNHNHHHHHHHHHHEGRRVTSYGELGSHSHHHKHTSQNHEVSRSQSHHDLGSHGHHHHHHKNHRVTVAEGQYHSKEAWDSEATELSTGSASGQSLSTEAQYRRKMSKKFSRTFSSPEELSLFLEDSGDLKRFAKYQSKMEGSSLSTEAQYRRKMTKKFSRTFSSPEELSLFLEESGDLKRFAKYHCMMEGSALSTEAKYRLKMSQKFGEIFTSSQQLLWFLKDRGDNKRYSKYMAMTATASATALGDRDEDPHGSATKHPLQSDSYHNRYRLLMLESKVCQGALSALHGANKDSARSKQSAPCPNSNAFWNTDELWIKIRASHMRKVTATGGAHLQSVQSRSPSHACRPQSAPVGGRSPTAVSREGRPQSAVSEAGRPQSAVSQRGRPQSAASRSTRLSLQDPAMWNAAFLSSQVQSLQQRRVKKVMTDFQPKSALLSRSHCRISDFTVELPSNFAAHRKSTMISGAQDKRKFSVFQLLQN